MIQTKSLSYSYSKKKKVVSNLSLNIPKGSIYGFLGANGAGKTTTIRLLLNLIKPDNGRILINGLGYLKNDLDIYKNIGTLIENPTFYGQLSGLNNLRIWANYYKVDLSIINHVLGLVQLSDAKYVKVKKYSQGMKQRLGIATALLHNPDLLILDEPLNGLDPKGIAEMRALFLDLKTRGKTIFLSSHILSEIEATCDRLCIIDKGCLKFEGTILELNQYLAKEVQFEIKCENHKKAEVLLSDYSSIINIEYINERIVVNIKKEESISGIIKALSSSGINLLEVKKKVNKLEDLYLKLTEE